MTGSMVVAVDEHFADRLLTENLPDSLRPAWARALPEPLTVGEPRQNPGIVGG
jgi:hypothetical protein